MSLLVVKLPPRERLGPRSAGPEAAAALRLPKRWDYVLSADGKLAGPLRWAAPAMLPKADQLVLVLAPADVSWHQVLVPKAPPARMAAALAGLLEERLLDDEADVHLALAPDALPGQPGWVVATHRPRLAAALAALEAAGRTVDRVVTLMPPPGPGMRGHFEAPELVRLDDAGELDAAAAAAAVGPDTISASDGEPLLCLSREDGVWCLPLAGATGPAGVSGQGLAEALRSTWGPEAAGQRWTTTPAAAWAAERFLGRPVPLQTEAEHLLEAATRGSPEQALNLRQFELASRHRGLRAVGAVGKRLLSAEWRWARYGLAAVLGFQLLGLNAYAWQQRQALQERRAAIDDLLRTTHPNVRTVLDAPLQMRVETERLRVAAGRPTDADLEAALNAAAAAWPEGKGPVGSLRFEAGRLVLAAPAWSAAEVAAVRERLRPMAWIADYAEGQLTLSRTQLAGGAP
jgi:general secretion pathway protein L